jgi:hypothetical protein
LSRGKTGFHFSGSCSSPHFSQRFLIDEADLVDRSWA